MYNEKKAKRNTIIIDAAAKSRTSMLQTNPILYFNINTGIKQPINQLAGARPSLNFSLLAHRPKLPAPIRK
jgi:hypothetical protein